MTLPLRGKHVLPHNYGNLILLFFSVLPPHNACYQGRTRSTAELDGSKARWGIHFRVTRKPKATQN